jgi:carboxylate-amine ligase
MSQPIAEFKQSQPLTLGVELELQLVSPRDFDLTRGATDLLGSMDYDGRFGEIKLEITESMIEVSTLPRTRVDGIAADLVGLRQKLVSQCARNHIVVCGGGTHPFHRWAERRICPGERFDEIYHRYGYLAKQFTVFGQHIHVGCTSGDEAIWLTQALAPYVPIFIALSASSPFVDGVDTLFQSARLNAVSAFPLSGQCPALNDWAEFVDHFDFLQACGIARSIKDLYWDIRPKPEFGTVEIRVCDTPLTVERARRWQPWRKAWSAISCGLDPCSTPHCISMSPVTTSSRPAAMVSMRRSLIRSASDRSLSGRSRVNCWPCWSTMRVRWAVLHGWNCSLDR